MKNTRLNPLRSSGSRALNSLAAVLSIGPSSFSSLASDQDSCSERLTRGTKLLAGLGSQKNPASKLGLRPYQKAAFDNRLNGIECWLWGRQTGKSYTLAAWAIDRLVTRPGRLVTILSNSLANGAELNQKCAEIARIYEQAFPLSPAPAPAPNLNPNPNLNLNPNLTPNAAPHLPAFIQQNHSPDLRFECMNYEIRFINGDTVSRIKILAANPRTARGFSGDLILDEFAFHENSTAIWEAAEPILSANPDFLCRIASTPNGRHNMFYRLATDPAIPTRIVPRSLAWEQGLVIAHPVTREPITPAESRALAVDKRAYDQNYECIFETQNMSLLTLDLISQAEDPSAGFICDDHWSPEALALLRRTGETSRAHLDSRSERLSLGNKSEAALGTHCAELSSVLASESPNFAVSSSFHSPNDGGATPGAKRLDPNRTGFLRSFPSENSLNSQQSTLNCKSALRGESPSLPSLPSVKTSALPSASSEFSVVKPPSPLPSLPSVNIPVRNFYVGVDVGRTHDITVISILEKTADLFFVRAILRLRNLRLPAQQEMLEIACRSPRFAAAQIDMTGLGLGLFEYTHQRFGDRVRGLNFASSISLPNLALRTSNFALGRVRVPEALALGLLQLYESKRIRHPIDPLLREDLRKPERVTNSNGRVSITASRDENGHADHFWSLALALDAAQRSPAPQIYIPRLRNRMHIPRNKFV